MLCKEIDTIMRLLVLSVLFFLLTGHCAAQMIGKRDYDAAFALQAGGTIAMPLPLGHPKATVQAMGGLKMTFPFNRKWFIGAEVNYEKLNFKSSYSIHGEGQASSPEKLKIKVGIEQIEVPVYLKYMLNCNRASVLLGFYGTYVFQSDPHPLHPEDTACPKPDKEWNAGLTLGYEYQLVKRLNVMCRLSMGMRDVIKPEYVQGKSFLPLQASLAISYDILRIGGCGCD